MKQLFVILLSVLAFSLNAQTISGVNSNGDSTTINLEGVPVLVAVSAKTLIYKDLTTKYTLNGSLASNAAKCPDFFSVTPSSTKGVYKAGVAAYINRNEIDAIYRISNDTLPGKTLIVMKNPSFTINVNNFYVDVMSAVDAPKDFARTYTPTFNATTNVDSLKIIGTTFSYIRTGDWVDVMGEVRIWTTNDSTATAAGISLPFASAITATNQISGIGIQQANWKDYSGGNITAHVSGDRAQLNFYAYTAGSTLFTVHFRYKILR